MAAINLIVGLCWFVAGSALIAYAWLNPAAPRLTLWHTDVNAGWLALLFALYNLSRWWSLRADAKTRRLVADMQDARTKTRGPSGGPPGGLVPPSDSATPEDDASGGR